MKIEILLADDQFLILEGIKAILEPEPEIEVVGTAQDGQNAIALVKELRPDILLIDIEMPQMNGISATKYICKYFPSTKVIVLTSHKNQDYIAEALLAGASGYLWKGNLIEDLKQEIYAFGKGYSGVKAKLLAQTTKENSATNTVKDRLKAIYFKKYRKNIYKPAVNQKKQQRCLYAKQYPLERLALQSRQTPNNIKLIKPNINKVSLVTKFKPLVIKKIRATMLKIFSISSSFNRRKHQRSIVWLLLGIFSIVLSIVIF